MINVPIIGIIKHKYKDSSIHITLTEKEVGALVKCGVDIIAMDVTNRLGPNGETLDEFFKIIRKRYPNVIFMADCIYFEDGKHVKNIGFDCVDSILSVVGNNIPLCVPNYEIISKLSGCLSIPIIAEGNIWAPEQLARTFKCGAHATVIGAAITRPREITKYFVNGLTDN